MKIHIPNSAFLGNIDSFLRSFKPENPQILEITANKKWISVHPVVLAMIASLGLRVGSANITCEEMEAKSKHYLERMGLFRMLSIPSGMKVEEHEPAGRFIPLTQIRESGELTDFIRNMVPLLHVLPKQAESIRHIITELVRNVIEHSHTSQGAIVCAQYYKKSNAIRIGIVDSGCGIKKSITMSHRAFSDLSAIKLALTPGITGTTKKEGGTANNAGAGLFIIKSIATVNRDHFMIYSGNAMYKLLTQKSDKKIKLHDDPFQDRHSFDEEMPYWQGTAVGIDLSLNQSQELSVMLDQVWDLYKQSIQKRKKARYKSPTFID